MRVHEQKKDKNEHDDEVRPDNDDYENNLVLLNLKSYVFKII